MPLLNLPDFNVLDHNENEHDIQLKVETKDAPKVCQNCLRMDSDVVGYGRKPHLFLDTPIRGKRVGLLVNRRKMQCRTCDTTFFENLRDMDPNRRMTRRLVSHIETQAYQRSFTHIAEDIGVDEKTVRNIFNDYVARMESEFTFETPQVMGIDEVHIIKPRCVITNIGQGTIVEMLPKRNKPDVIKFLTTLDASEVRVVAIDMWNPYRDAVNAVMPHANIVVDKFHIVRMANEAMERCRKATRASITTAQNRGLKKSRFILLRRKSELDMNEQITFDSWTRNFPDLGLTYELKEAFFEIWDRARNRREAEVFYDRWKACITPEVEPYFFELLRAMDNWRTEIFNYFDNRFTNAFTERLNSKIRDMYRSGRGYSFEVLRAKILFNEGLHKTFEKKPRYDRYAFGRTVAFDTHVVNYGTHISTLLSKIENQTL